MILKPMETGIQLTYTPEEYNEFNLATVAFRREINDTLRSEISALDGDDREYFQTLIDEFVQTLDYIDSAMIVTRSETGFQLKAYARASGRSRCSVQNRNMGVSCSLVSNEQGECRVWI